MTGPRHPCAEPAGTLTTAGSWEAPLIQNLSKKYTNNSQHNIIIIPGIMPEYYFIVKLDSFIDS